MMEAAVIGRGIPVSPGVVEDPLKIGDSPEDVNRVNPGDIVVAKYSNPPFALAENITKSLTDGMIINLGAYEGLLDGAHE